MNINNPVFVVEMACKSYKTKKNAYIESAKKKKKQQQSKKVI